MSNDEMRRLLRKEKTDKRFTQVKLQIPGGYLCGKWWGPKDVRPILGIHGWMDNCGVFDKLIPLLPKEYSYLVFDLPGHGLSSKYPDGMIYSYYDVIVLIERIRREYNWEKLSLFGHSLGSYCCFFYSAMFPDTVDIFIAGDALEPSLMKPGALMKLNLTLLLKTDADEKEGRKSEPPAYDYEELLEKVVKGSSFSVDRDSAKHLLLRNVKRSTKYPRKYYFNYDRRLKGFERVSRHPVEILSFASNIKTPILYLLAEDSYMKNLNFKQNEPIRNFLLANNPGFRIFSGPGTHHFLLTNPEAYADEISKFLREYRPLQAKL